MTPQDLYREKLTPADDAVTQIGSGMNLAMGMAVAEPPALLEALGRRRDQRSAVMVFPLA